MTIDCKLDKSDFLTSDSSIDCRVVLDTTNLRSDLRIMNQYISCETTIPNSSHIDHTKFCQ